MSLALCGFLAAWKVRRTDTAEARLLGMGAVAALLEFWSAAAVELTLLREWVVTTLFTLLGLSDRLQFCRTLVLNELGESE